MTVREGSLEAPTRHPVEWRLPDFYDEVKRFEIDLIRRALDQTSGHQSRAARLLGLNATTLNSKIKSYNIHTRSEPR